MADDKVNYPEVGMIAQALKFQIRNGKQWEDLTPAAKESLDIIATSIARIVVYGERDDWASIARFALLVAKPESDPAPTIDIERGIRSLVRELPRNGNA